LGRSGEEITMVSTWTAVLLSRSNNSAWVETTPHYWRRWLRDSKTPWSSHLSWRLEWCIYCSHLAWCRRQGKPKVLKPYNENGGAVNWQWQKSCLVSLFRSCKRRSNETINWLDADDKGTIRNNSANGYPTRLLSRRTEIPNPGECYRIRLFSYRRMHEGMLPLQSNWIELGHTNVVPRDGAKGDVISASVRWSWQGRDMLSTDTSTPIASLVVPPSPSRKPLQEMVAMDAKTTIEVSTLKFWNHGIWTWQAYCQINAYGTCCLLRVPRIEHNTWLI
jgi:hypothetical protein